MKNPDTDENHRPLLLRKTLLVCKRPDQEDTAGDTCKCSELSVVVWSDSFPDFHPSRVGTTPLL